MAEHRNCAKCENAGVFTGLIGLIGIGVAFFGHGGHAIAGAIVAVGLELAAAFERWTLHH